MLVNPLAAYALFRYKLRSFYAILLFWLATIAFPAEIDGASEWVTFWNITITLLTPILAVIALETFVSVYGIFFYALILAPDPKMWTIMVHIY